MLLEKYNGLMCEVTDLNNRLIASGVLWVSGEDVDIYDPDGHLPILNLGTQVKFSLRSAELGARVMAGQIYLSNRTFMRLVEVKSYSEFEKRRYFRLAIDHSAQLLPGKDPEGPLEKRPEETLEWEVPIRLKDISLCGMQFESDSPLTVGDRMRVRVALVHNELVTFDILVRRVIPRFEEMTRYGCEIVDLLPYAEQKLCAFIFGEQQRQIRSSRG